MKKPLIPRGYRDQYRQTLTLAIPIVLSQMGQVIVQFADNLMVGRLGAVPLAAVSFAGAVFFLFFIFGIGITMGLTPLVGQSYTRGQHRLSSAYFLNSLLLYSVVGAMLLCAMLAVVPLLSRMGQTPEVAAMSVDYYKYLAWSIVPYMVFAPFKQFLEGIGNTRVVMIIVLTSNLLNIVLNYLLIHGVWIFPQMGAAGAGLATLISRICMPLAIAIYFMTKDSLKRYLSIFSSIDIRRTHVVSLLRVGSPIALQMTMEGAAFALISIMMGWLGAEALAGHQIALTMASCTFMAVIGISSATTIRVSHEFGRGNLRELRRAAKASLHMVVAWNACAALVFIALRFMIGHLFSPDPAVVDMAAYLLIFAAIFQISDGLQNVSLGILRGMQDVRSTMIIAFVSYILVNLPVSYFCAFILKMGAGGLWVGFIFGLSLAAVLLYVRFGRIYRKLREAAR